MRAVGKADKVKGEIVKLSGFLQNITERKKEQIAFRNSVGTFNRAQKEARLGSWDWDIETGDVSWSLEMFSIMEMNSEKDKPSYSIALEKVHPDDREFYEKSIKYALEKNKVYNI